MKYFFVMGYPYSSDKNAKQEELFTALERNKDKVPVSLTVYLLKTGGGRLLTVCEWPEERNAEIEANGGLWGNTSMFRRWVDESSAPRYEDADILGPRTHDVREIDGPSEVLSSFSTGTAHGGRIAAAAPAQAAKERQDAWLRDLGDAGPRAGVGTTPASRPTQVRYSGARSETSWAWWLMPIFFNLIGGIVAWIALKQNDRNKAQRILWLGIALCILWFFFVFVIATSAE